VDLLPYNIRKLSENGHDGGTSAQRLLRKMAREHPDVLDRYKAGEFKSVRAAAKEAGIVKDVKPFDQIKKLLPKLTATERRKLKELLS
jgi:hypothetical protein